MTLIVSKANKGDVKTFSKDIRASEPMMSAVAPRVLTDSSVSESESIQFMPSRFTSP